MEQNSGKMNDTQLHFVSSWAALTPHRKVHLPIFMHFALSTTNIVTKEVSDYLYGPDSFFLKARPNGRRAIQAILHLLQNLKFH